MAQKSNWRQFAIAVFLGGLFLSGYSYSAPPSGTLINSLIYKCLDDPNAYYFRDQQVKRDSIKPSSYSFPLSEADKANGIEYKATYTVTYISKSKADPQAEWKDAKTHFYAEIKHGRLDFSVGGYGGTLARISDDCHYARDTANGAAPLNVPRQIIRITSDLAAVPLSFDDANWVIKAGANALSSDFDRRRGTRPTRILHAGSFYKPFFRDQNDPQSTVVVVSGGHQYILAQTITSSAIDNDVLIPIDEYDPSLCCRPAVVVQRELLAEKKAKAEAAADAALSPREQFIRERSKDREKDGQPANDPVKGIAFMTVSQDEADTIKSDLNRPSQQGPISVANIYRITERFPASDRITAEQYLSPGTTFKQVERPNGIGSYQFYTRAGGKMLTLVTVTSGPHNGETVLIDTRNYSPNSNTSRAPMK